MQVASIQSVVSKLATYLALCFFIILAFGPFFGPGANAATVAPSANSSVCIQSPPVYAEQSVETDVPVIRLQQTESNSTARLVLENPPSDLELDYTGQPNLEFTESQGFHVNGDQLATVAGDPEQAWINVTTPKIYRAGTRIMAEHHSILRLPSTNQKVHFEPLNEGYVGHRFALLGTHSIYNRTVGCQDITVVAPTGENVDFRLEPAGIADDVATASSEISLGHRHSRIITFISPSGFGEVGGYVPGNPETRTGGNEIILSINASREQANYIVFHEYIHTTQRNLEPEWVAEGQASYLATELAIHEGYVKPRYASYDNRHLINESTGRAITTGWREPYARGYFFFASLDRRLAAYNTSLESVMRVVNNQHRRPPEAGTTDLWEAAIENTTGEQVALTHPYEQSPEVVYWIENPQLSYNDRMMLGAMAAPFTQLIPLLVLLILFCRYMIQMAKD